MFYAHDSSATESVCGFGGGLASGRGGDGVG